ncbi:MAG: diguanylate cyclase domain-containing protein [Acidiferrobacterales bacterium]
MGDSDDKTIQIPARAPAPRSTHQRPCLTFLSGGPVGLVYTLLAATETLIGRGGEADIPVEEPRVSRKHAVFKVNRKGHVVVEDQGSSNGTFVNGDPVDKKKLKDGDRVQIGYACIIKFSYQDDLEYQLQQEIAAGIKDPVTGLYTKQYLQERVETEFAYAQRHKGQLGVLMFAVDSFHEISLMHGLPAGDLILKEVAHRVSQILRAGDICARYEGERFAVVARDLNQRGSAILAQRIRKILNGHQCDFEGTPIHLTVSIGIATLADKPGKGAKLIDIAEKSLHKAKKESGRSGFGAASTTILQSSEASPTLLYPKR